MSLLVSLLLAASPALTTVAEQSGYIRTGRYAEVESLCQAFAKAFPQKAACTQFGTTPMGRPMVYLAASSDGMLSAEATAKANRPVVFLQGGIHAGEIDGKDAGFKLLRDLLEEKVLPGVLKTVTLVFVPVLNVDGHENFRKNNRPNQIGPEAMGFRVTSHNLNLNRDYTKADAPEMQAVLRLMRSFDPVVFADLHVTDGAKFQHDVSITLEPFQLGPQPLRELGAQLKTELLAQLTASKHLPVGFYPDFVKSDDPASGFAYQWGAPRFGTVYWSMVNRFGVLVETHAWKDYKTRVALTYDACVALLDSAKNHAQQWRAAQLAADTADATRDSAPVVLTTEASTKSRQIDFLGYAYTREASEISGQPWVKYDDTKRMVWKVPLFEELVPKVTVSPPRGGYLIPPPHSAWVREKLNLHGIEWRPVAKELQKANVQTFFAAPTFAAKPFEGRQLLTLKGDWKPDTVTVPAGTLFVPIAQPRMFLAMHLLEPTAPDSFAAWGFFNAHFERKEYLEPYVTEVFAREQLKNPAVRVEFEARLKDEAFAKSPAAKLEFFADRHPSADPFRNRYPVFRTADSFSATQLK
jgi:murein tripeptide amidase MpaA